MVWTLALVPNQSHQSTPSEGDSITWPIVACLRLVPAFCLLRTTDRRLRVEQLGSRQVRVPQSSSLGPTRQGHRLDPRMAVAYSTDTEKTEVPGRFRAAGTTVLGSSQSLPACFLGNLKSHDLGRGKQEKNNDRAPQFANPSGLHFELRNTRRP